MTLPKNKPSWKTAILILGCCAVSAGLIAFGYWEGQRALRQQIASGRGGGFDLAGNSQVSPPVIPPNASPEMKEFLQNQAILAQRMQQVRGPGNGVLSPQAFARFREENANLLKRQNELAQTISKQEGSNKLSTPPPLQIPPKASPQLQTFLTARDKLMRDEIALMNQHANDDFATRQAAMEKWRKQNAAQIQQLQQLAKAASVDVSGTATTTTTK